MERMDTDRNLNVCELSRAKDHSKCCLEQDSKPSAEPLQCADLCCRYCEKKVECPSHCRYDVAEEPVECSNCGETEIFRHQWLAEAILEFDEEGELREMLSYNKKRYLQTQCLNCGHIFMVSNVLVKIALKEDAENE